MRTCGPARGGLPSPVLGVGPSTLGYDRRGVVRERAGHCLSRRGADVRDNGRDANMRVLCEDRPANDDERCFAAQAGPLLFVPERPLRA